MSILFGTLIELKGRMHLANRIDPRRIRSTRKADLVKIHFFSHRAEGLLSKSFGGNAFGNCRINNRLGRDQLTRCSEGSDSCGDVHGGSKKVSVAPDDWTMVQACPRQRQTMVFTAR